LAFYYANHLVNPILYAIRKPEYRSAVLALFRNRPQRERRVADLPLRNKEIMGSNNVRLLRIKYLDETSS